jgi:hypothetical protein
MGGHGRGGSHALKVKNFRAMDHRNDGDYFSKRLLLAEEEVPITTLVAAIEDETDRLLPFVQQSLNYIRHSILERNNRLDDSLALELRDAISNIRSTLNDDDTGNEHHYHDFHRGLANTMTAENELRKGTIETILENMINSLPMSLENDQDWEVFVMEGFKAASAQALSTVLNMEERRLRQNLVTIGGGGTEDDDNNGVDDRVETPDTIIGQLLYLLKKFVWGPVVGVLLWMIRAPYNSYCIICGLNEYAELPFCFKATDDFCEDATPADQLPSP